MLKRWIIRCLFMLPVLLLAGGWLWSGTHHGNIAYVHDGRAVVCDSRQGVLDAVLGRGLLLRNGWDGGVDPLDPARYWPQSRPHSWLGFGVEHVRSPRWDGYFVSVPYWFLLPASAGACFLVWRKTRPNMNPANAFPVDVVNPK